MCMALLSKASCIYYIHHHAERRLPFRFFLLNYIHTFYSDALILMLYNAESHSRSQFFFSLLLFSSFIAANAEKKKLLRFNFSPENEKEKQTMGLIEKTGDYANLLQ